MEEFESGSRPVEAISTSTAGFIGLAAKGELCGAPMLVTSFADYQRRFGGLLDELTFGEYRYMPLAVEQFFANGGSRAFVMRVAPSDAECATASRGSVLFRARSEGCWGNSVTVTVSDVSKTRVQVVEALDDGTYRVKSLSGLAVGDVVSFDKEYNRVVKITGNLVTFEKPFAGEVVDTGLVPKRYVCTVEANISVNWEGEVENYEFVSLNPASGNYIEKRFAKSVLLAVSVQSQSGCGSVVEALGGERLAKSFFTLGGGLDGSVDTINAATYIGRDNGPGQRTGLAAFIENSYVNIMAIPGITLPDVVVSLVAHCENAGSRFAVLDVPRDTVKVDEVARYRELVDSTYAAFYHPWIQVFDQVAQKPVFIPPSGAVMGVYARSDTARGVHKAPANETVATSALSCAYNQGEQDILNPLGVNLIRAFPGQGIRIWGARTASSNAAFKYVNVRRLFIFLEESIKASTNWVVFEPNDEALWGRVQRTIEGFLTTMWRAGALMGTSPAEAFYVDVSRNTMTEDDIGNGRLICVIGVAPSKPAEFVVFRITQLANQSSTAE